MFRLCHGMMLSIATSFTGHRQCFLTKCWRQIVSEVRLIIPHFPNVSNLFTFYGIIASSVQIHIIFFIKTSFITYRSPSFISTISSVHWSFAVCTAHLLCNQTYCTWYINLGFRYRLAQYFIVFPPRLRCIWTFRLPQAPSFGEIRSMPYQHSVRIALIYPTALIRFIDRSEVEYCDFEIPLNIGTLSSPIPQNWIPRYLIMGTFLSLAEFRVLCFRWHKISKYYYYIFFTWGFSNWTSLFINTPEKQSPEYFSTESKSACCRFRTNGNRLLQKMVPIFTVMQFRFLFLTFKCHWRSFRCQRKIIVNHFSTL